TDATEKQIKYLDRAYASIKTKFDDTLVLPVTPGQLTLVSDGWTNIRGESIINYMLVTPEGGAYFHSSETAGVNSHTGEFLAQRMMSVSSNFVFMLAYARSRYLFAMACRVGGVNAGRSRLRKARTLGCSTMLNGSPVENMTSASSSRNDSFSPSSMLSIEVVQIMYTWHKNKKLSDDEFIDTFKEAVFPQENMLPMPTEAAEAHDHASLAEA
ncbi:hypothetical protein E4U23_006275, partial [Claviceps purpurea]